MSPLAPKQVAALTVDDNDVLLDGGTEGHIDLSDATLN